LSWSQVISARSTARAVQQAQQSMQHLGGVSAATRALPDGAADVTADPGEVRVEHVPHRGPAD